MHEKLSKVLDSKIRQRYKSCYEERLSMNKVFFYLTLRLTVGCKGFKDKFIAALFISACIFFN